MENPISNTAVLSKSDYGAGLIHYDQVEARNSKSGNQIAIANGNRSVEESGQYGCNYPTKSDSHVVQQLREIAKTI